MTNPAQSQSVCPKPEFLNDEFGNESVSFEQVAPGLVKAVLGYKDSTAEVHLQGAHVTSWVSAGRESLFLSDRAEYAAGKPIRGGIPIIAPQFGSGPVSDPGPLPSHGFARKSVWRVVETGAPHEATVMKLELSNTDIDQTFRQVWPHEFVMQLEVKLDGGLTTSLTIKNVGASPFGVTSGFHNYFAVDELKDLTIGSLDGLRYRDDTLPERPEGTERRLDVTVDRYTDRLYMDAPDLVQLMEVSPQVDLCVQTVGCKDGQLWNPWSDKEPDFADLAEGDYKRFVCYEPGNMASKLMIEPGAEHVSSQSLSVFRY